MLLAIVHAIIATISNVNGLFSLGIRQLELVQMTQATAKQSFTVLKTSFVSMLTLFLLACTPYVPIISPDSAYKLLVAKKAVIIDVRENDEWLEQHIEGAVHIPLDQIESRLSELFQYKDNTVIMHCRSGRRSRLAGEILMAAGFSKVYNLEGGILAWDAEGLATVISATPITK